MRPFELRLQRLTTSLIRGANWLSKEYVSSPPPCKKFGVLDNDDCSKCKEEQNKFCKQVIRFKEIIDEMNEIQESNKDKDLDIHLITHGRSK